MPDVQTVHAEDHHGSAARGATTPKGLFACAGKLIWRRRDWPSAVVGSFDNLLVVPMRSVVRNNEQFKWNLIKLSDFVLSRHAALLLLQGMRLNEVLIPNHELLHEQGALEQVAHILLRCDPWDVSRPVATLTGLRLAQLGALPPGLHPSEVMGALASDSASA